MTQLSSEECLELLGSVTVGHVAVSIDALPAIRTVRFVLTPAHVVFKAGANSRLRRAAKNAVVAFHADSCNEDRREGWCVLVQGLGDEVTDLADLAELRPQLDLWAPEDEEAFLRVSLSHVTGEHVIW